MTTFPGQFIVLQVFNMLNQGDYLQDGLTMVVSEYLQKFLVVSVDVFCSFGALKVVSKCCIFIHRIK